ncbi:DeoR/GlpR family DNA-binding transcription regulator [Paenibacillus sp.]|uniref:DeoR/GlpR family DNA-binding transcription regulator n=1 Tax=Paenibacillus sp. TaxID=58172 RepID=UPI002D51FCCB|nr:DeoR/GlpR family DNA-binding transcription regulator [Paenibacillus sp.]HZG57797.1 DeoR/GlpR family DNA-binding transcription regulator [Paenibacillus sp.]
MSEAKSKGERRREDILTLLKRNGELSVKEIVDAFGCSEATARRDLDVLSKSREVIRTIGGAAFEGYTGAEASFHEKKHISWLEKEAIAATAASLVEEGDVIGLTGGSTTFMIARALKSRRNITIVTNAINIAYELADSDGLQVVVTGGVMRGKSFELCGPLAETTVSGLHIGTMFLGVDGVTAAHGVTTHNELEARIGRQLMERSSRTIAVFDRSKAGRASLFGIAPLEALAGCITDAPLDEPLAGALRDRGIPIWISERKSNP